MITIATTNIDKYQKATKLLSQFFPNLEIKPLPDGVPTPDEDGSTELENAIIKANFYSQFVQTDVLSIDDGIYFDQLREDEQPGAHIHRYNQTIEKTMNIVDYWKSYIKKKNLKSGNLIKAFALKHRTDTDKNTVVKVPFLVREIATVTVRSTNPLNNFMIPIGFNNSFAELEESDRITYNNYYFKNAVHYLFD